MARRKLIAGNWKMHGIAGDLGEITRISMASETLSAIDTAICVPATLLERAAEAAPGFVIGGQDVHAEPHEQRHTHPRQRVHRIDLGSYAGRCRGGNRHRRS